MTSTSTIEINQSFKWKALLFWNAIGVLLFTSLFNPWTAPLWNKIDTAFFYFINQPLKTNQNLRIFWAIANHRFADWFEDLCILGFYVAAIWKTQKSLRMKKGLELFFCVLLTALTILAINRLLCRDLLRLRRTSPTLMLENSVHLSDFLPWIDVKVDSNKSFPGDHATTAIMITCSYAYLVRGKLAIIALLYGIFLCLPRLAAGAHWLSDIVVGSGCIVIFSLSWGLLSPLREVFIKRVKHVFKPRDSASKL